MKKLAKKLQSQLRAMLIKSGWKKLHYTYDDYIIAQTVTFKGFEKDNERWVEGQQRFIDSWLSELPRDIVLLDIACGDGVGLRYFKLLGFKKVIGAEIDNDKLRVAAESGYEVYKQDIHCLDNFENDKFDVVYSSHTLEHALYPNTVLNEFHRVLKPSGLLFIVLPFPDKSNDRAHCGKFILGTYKDDEGRYVINYIESFGYKLLRKHYDSFRENEIWLNFRKI